VSIVESTKRIPLKKIPSIKNIKLSRFAMRKVYFIKQLVIPKNTIRYLKIRPLITVVVLTKKDLNNA